jgi:hypothetical protein
MKDLQPRFSERQEEYSMLNNDTSTPNVITEKSAPSIDKDVILRVFVYFPVLLSLFLAFFSIPFRNFLRFLFPLLLLFPLSPLSKRPTLDMFVLKWIIFCGIYYLCILPAFLIRKAKKIPFQFKKENIRFASIFFSVFFLIMYAFMSEAFESWQAHSPSSIDTEHALRGVIPVSMLLILLVSLGVYFMLTAPNQEPGTKVCTVALIAPAPSHDD